VSVDSVRILRSLATSLISGEVVEARTPYEQSSAAGLGMLVMQLSSQLEVATEWLVEENTTLRALFRDATEAVADPDLVQQLRAAGHGYDEGLRFSVLRAANDALRELLVELHAYVEAQEGAAASALEEKIWAELRRSVERRSRV